MVRQHKTRSSLKKRTGGGSCPPRGAKIREQRDSSGATERNEERGERLAFFFCGNTTGSPQSTAAKRGHFVGQSRRHKRGPRGKNL